LSGKLALIAVPLLVAHAAPSRAGVEGMKPEPAATEEDATADDADAGGAARYYPPPVDGPALRLPESPTRLYIDDSYAVATDLTALPYIAGTADNFRAAVGAAWRWRRFTFDGQIPLNVTRINVTQVLNGPPRPEDQRQTSVALGDITLGVTWTERVTGGEGLIAGLGLRGRLPTHTTNFDFTLPDGTIARFVIPYYFHIEPTVVLGGANGRFTYVMNQGVNLFVGPDGYFEQQHIVVPSIFFYDAHYAISYAPWSFLGASLELATMIQLNHVASTPDQDLRKFNDIRAAWVAPALQFYKGAYRIDAIVRYGLTRGQEVYGVLEYVGTHSATLRLTRHF
jgi:hypothetical protein